VPSAPFHRTPLDPESNQGRVVAAALRCIARWGLSKTTLDDIAREAGCSRATVYRLFPGGKPALIDAVGQHEIARLLLAVTDQIDAAADLEELLVEAIGAASGFFRGSDALAMLLEHEPGVLLPIIAFDQLDPVLEVVAAFLGPLVARFVDERTAAELVEWSARLVLSYTFEPSEFVDLGRPDDVRRLVRTHLLPGARLAACADEVPAPADVAATAR
jgi:AcrR family transcriptional regulator